MKACRICGRLYPDDGGFCPVDGQELYSATQVPIPSDDNDPRVGQLICQRYQVRRVVADGGMGRVYEALDMQERRNVALKVLHPDVARDEVSVERFKREFEVSKQLPHMHIVEVTDFQPTTDGSYVLVMEFLYGEELRATLKREQVLRPERAIRMLSQVAVGIDPAHSSKLVHRDLKPDNIFLCQTSEGDIAKILDFGSVKDKADSAKKLTVIGTTIGSPFYMSPEQAQGLDTLDHRADVWALAAIFYECITGQVPFKGANGPSILLEILTKEPAPPSQAAKDTKYPVPPTVDRVLATGMKKAAALRYKSVGELATALGKAYGLEGDHSAWATTPEKALGERIAAQAGNMMEAPTAAAGGVVDDFFGEADGLGAMDAAFGEAAGPTMGAAGSGAVARTDAHSLTNLDPANYGVPSRPVWILPAIVGLLALVVGVVVVLATR